MKIITILCRPGTMNNYAYLLIDEKTGTSAVVDPSEAAPVIAACQQHDTRPSYILNTHHHFDHTDGNLEVKQFFKAKVIGHDADAGRIPGIDLPLKDGDTFSLGASQAQIISVDGHTLGHILWYFPGSKAVFTGDMLFNLCIGGIFEGTPDQMWQSVQKLKALPDDTLFYPGHEYTLYGAREALYFSHNAPEVVAYLDNARHRLEQDLPAGPITLEIEKKCNPYLSASTKEEFLQRLQH